MEEIYANVEFDKSVKPRPSTNETGTVRFHRCVVFCLGLLCVFLLAGLVGLGVTYLNAVRDSSAELSAVKANMTESLQISNDRLSSASKERDQLNATLAEMTKKRDRLQNDSKQKKTCPEGWRTLCRTCFFFSSRSDSWENGRQDCRDRGADLAVIDNYEEQEFLSYTIKQDAWIGLNDRDNEGTWKWIDDTPLNVTYWQTLQPDNGNGDQRWDEEDCAHLLVGFKTGENWNDRRCSDSLKWICEKNN